MNASTPVQRLTLVVADDNADVRAFIRLLVDPFADVHECADGAAAVALHGSTRPDAVLLDVSMPVMNGIEATRRITRADAAARVVIVTGLEAEPALRAAALAAGACAFVSKEDLSQLPTLLTSLCGTGGKS